MITSCAACLEIYYRLNFYRPSFDTPRKFTGRVSPSFSEEEEITTFEAFTFVPERPILTWSWDTFTIRGYCRVRTLLRG
jgi:hypothetical protein